MIIHTWVYMFGREKSPDLSGFAKSSSGEVPRPMIDHQSRCMAALLQPATDQSQAS